MYEFSLKQGTKLRDLRLKQGQGLNTRAVLPTRAYAESPPPPKLLLMCMSNILWAPGMNPGI